jgi:hypothetical protein
MRRTARRMMPSPMNVTIAVDQRKRTSGGAASPPAKRAQ